MLPGLSVREKGTPVLPGCRGRTTGVTPASHLYTNSLVNAAVYEIPAITEEDIGSRVACTLHSPSNLTPEISRAALIYRPADHCPILRENLSYITPFKFEYDIGETAQITCFEQFVVSNAKSENQDHITVECWENGNWVYTRGFGIETVYGCVECNAKVECSNGKCDEGRCICDPGFSKDRENPRLCSPTRCPNPDLFNQYVDREGPYKVGHVVTIKCVDGFYARGRETQQELVCLETGYFDELLQPCVVCDHSNDCVNGYCNSNDMCECDEHKGYRLSTTDPRLCERIDFE